MWQSDVVDVRDKLRVNDWSDTHLEILEDEINRPLKNLRAYPKPCAALECGQIVQVLG